MRVVPVREIVAVVIMVVLAGGFFPMLLAQDAEEK
jgi:hypothetical protein